MTTLSDKYHEILAITKQHIQRLHFNYEYYLFAENISKLLQFQYMTLMILWLNKDEINLVS